MHSLTLTLDGGEWSHALTTLPTGKEPLVLVG